MNNIMFSFIITTIAGLSTLIGMFPCFLKIKNTNKIICICLAFAAGVMASVSMFSLSKEAYHLLNITYRNTPTIILITIYILIGIFMASVIDKLFRNIDNKLYKIGLINALALMIHNIPEGILTFSTTTTNISLGITLAITIILHNIPEGISISVPIFYATKNRKKALLYTAISGFSEIFGALITYLFLSQYINNNFIGITLSLTIGIMSYIAFFELLPNSFEYEYKKHTIISFIIGFIFMFFFK